MANTTNLRPLQTGDACYLTEHHNRDGACIITVTMYDGCATKDAAQLAIVSALAETPCEDMPLNWRDLFSVMAWCAEQWRLAQADMPAAADRDNDGDDSDRYLECHILATWEVGHAHLSLPDTARSPGRGHGSGKCHGPHAPNWLLW